MTAKVKKPAAPKVQMPKTKHINGYLKKDGTYVAPYLRSK